MVNSHSQTSGIVKLPTNKYQSILTLIPNGTQHSPILRFISRTHVTQWHSTVPKTNLKQGLYSSLLVVPKTHQNPRLAVVVPKTHQNRGWYSWCPKPMAGIIFHIKNKNNWYFFYLKKNKTHPDRYWYSWYLKP